MHQFIWSEFQIVDRHKNMKKQDVSDPIMQKKTVASMSSCALDLFKLPDIIVRVLEAFPTLYAQRSSHEDLPLWVYNCV